MQELKDAEGGAKGSKRPRNSALTWDLPPPLADGAREGQPGADEAGESSTTPASEAGLHPDVVAQRAAFSTIGDQHLRAIVQQLLQAEGPEVPRL